MLIRTDRREVFDVRSSDLWKVLIDVGGYTSWWPWLRAFDGTVLAVGQVWCCEVRPSFLYRVRFELTIVEVSEAEQVRVDVRGDISGTATLEIVERGNSCELRLLSQLSPDGAWLRILAIVGRPVLTQFHDWVLDAGERQFRRHLSATLLDRSG